jgi:hypothetical protein
MVTRLPPLVPELSATGNCSPKEGDIGPKHLGKIERGRYWIVDVPNGERAYAIAGRISAASSNMPIEVWG